MPTPEVNSFQDWIFSEEEFNKAAVFPDLNLKWIQSTLAGYAQQKVNLAFDPTNPDAFIKEHEYLRGAMDSLNFILTSHQNITDKSAPGDII